MIGSSLTLEDIKSSLSKTKKIKFRGNDSFFKVSQIINKFGSWEPKTEISIYLSSKKINGILKLGLVSPKPTVVEENFEIIFSVPKNNCNISLKFNGEFTVTGDFIIK